VNGCHGCQPEPAARKPGGIAMRREAIKKAWESFTSQLDNQLIIMLSNDWDGMCSFFVSKIDESVYESVYAVILFALEFGAYVGRLERDEKGLNALKD